MKTENTDTLQYESLDQKDLLRIFNENGVVNILMQSKHAKACCLTLKIAKYFKYDVKTKNKSTLNKIYMFLLGLFSTIRNLLFHSKLLEVSVF